MNSGPITRPSTGQLCSSSQVISGRSSAMPRSSVIGLCVCALTRPGIRTCSGNATVCVGAYAARAALVGSTAMIWSLSTATAWCSRTTPSGSTGMIQRASISRSTDCGVMGGSPWGGGGVVLIGCADCGCGVGCWFVVGLRPGWSTFNRTLFAAVRRRFAPGGARSFLLLAQEKQNQREGTPACVPFGFAPGLRGFADGPSMARRRTGRRPVGHPAGLILHPSAAPEGDPAAQRAARFANQEGSLCTMRELVCLRTCRALSLDVFALAALIPSGGGVARRTRPEGWPTGRRPFFCGPWMARQKNPAARNALVGRSPASAGRGCPSLWFRFSWARKRNERAPAGRDTPPHGGKECPIKRGPPRAKPPHNTIPCLFHPADVFAGPRIHLDHLVLCDEQRHADHGAGFQLGRLAAAAGGVAAYAGVGLDDLQFHEVGRGHRDRGAVEQRHHAFFLALEPLRRVAHGGLVGLVLLECAGVHEVPELAVGVQVLHVRFHDVGAFERLARLERLFGGAAVEQVANLDAGEGLALARLDEVGVDDVVGVAVDQDLDTGFDIVQSVTGHAVTPRQTAARRAATMSETPAPAPVWKLPMITATAARTQPAGGADWRQLWRQSVTDGRELLHLLGLDHLAERLPADDAGFAVRVPRGRSEERRVGEGWSRRWGRGRGLRRDEAGE